MAQVYTKTGWVDDVTPVSAQNLNNMESGVYLASAPIVTTLPATPVDGQECNLLADATNGIVWHLVYRAAEPGPYKWYFTGGAPMQAVVDADESFAATAYSDLATVGPSLVLPYAGDYMIEFSVNIYVNAAAAGGMNVSGPGVAPADDANCLFTSFNGVGQQTSHKARRRTFTSPGTVKAQYHTNGLTCNFRWRELFARPVRIG